MEISELRPFAKKVDVAVKAISKGEIRDVVSKQDNTPLRVTEILVGDKSGVIQLTLWNDDIEKVEEGKCYKISNGYTTTFRNSLRLNIGKYGTLESSEDDIKEVNTENNISEKEFGGN